MPDELLVFLQQFCILLVGFGDVVQSSTDSKLIAGRGSVTKACLEKLCCGDDCLARLLQGYFRQIFSP